MQMKMKQLHRGGDLAHRFSISLIAPTPAHIRASLDVGLLVAIAKRICLSQFLCRYSIVGMRGLAWPGLA